MEQQAKTILAAVREPESAPAVLPPPSAGSDPVCLPQAVRLIASVRQRSAGRDRRRIHCFIVRLPL